MTKYNIERVPEDSPERCEGITSKGQCINKRIKGSRFCPVHGGNKALESQRQKEVTNYRLSKYRVRHAEMRNSDSLKSLRDEIGILRIVMEELLNKCDDNLTLIRFAPQISDMALKIQKLVTSANKLDRDLGRYVDKSQIIQMAQAIVSFISEEVTDSRKIERINNKILEIIEESNVIDD